MKDWNGFDAGCQLVMGSAAEVHLMLLGGVQCGAFCKSLREGGRRCGGLLPAGLRISYIW